MGNCCRIFTNLSEQDCVNLVGNHPAVKAWGENAIRKASNSYFGRVPECCKDLTEINLVNNITEVNNEIHRMGLYCQDLDGCGADKVFSLS